MNRESNGAGKSPGRRQGPPGVEELVEQLRQFAQHSSSLARTLESYVAAVADAGSPASASEAAGWQAKLAAVEADRDQLVESLIETEKRATRVMSLYVATYQLHATLNPQDVYEAIAEVAVDLLGAQSFALLLRQEDGGARIALARHVSSSLAPRFAGEQYPGGDPQVDATFRDGILRIGQQEGSDACAVVPLRVEAGILGVLAILQVFEHKTAPLEQDRELLDLLSAHAGSALLAAESYCKTDRKLRTLRDLVTLLPATR